MQYSTPRKEFQADLLINRSVHTAKAGNYSGEFYRAPAHFLKPNHVKSSRTGVKTPRGSIGFHNLYSKETEVGLEQEGSNRPDPELVPYRVRALNPTEVR